MGNTLEQSIVQTAQSELASIEGLVKAGPGLDSSGLADGLMNLATLNELAQHNESPLGEPALQAIKEINARALGAVASTVEVPKVDIPPELLNGFVVDHCVGTLKWLEEQHQLDTPAARFQEECTALAFLTEGLLATEHSLEERTVKALSEVKERSQAILTERGWLSRGQGGN